MKTLQIFAFTVLVIFSGVLIAGENEIINLYDAFGEEAGDAIQDWGFAAFVRYNGKVILFDGGSSAEILAQNAKLFGVDLKDVEIAVLSHSHYDHISGFDYLIEINPDVKLFLPNDRTIGGRPASNAEQAQKNSQYRRGYRFLNADTKFVAEHREISPGVNLIATTSSMMGLFSKYPPNDKEPLFIGLPELSLVLQNEIGESVIITGCSHSGVERIVQETKKHLGSNVAGVAGGFHLMPYVTEYISSIAKQMKEEFQVNWVAPGHCTDESAHKIFQSLYNNKYQSFGLGSKITF